MIDTSFYTYLTSIAGVTVYPGLLPQNAAPAVTFARSDSTREQVYSGVSTLQYVEFDVNCWSTTALASRNTAETITASLVAFRGTMGADHCDNALLTRDIDIYEPETRLYRVALGFRVFYDL